MKNRTIAGSIGTEIRRRILDGRYPAGSQLRQDGLAAEFGASRIPVREALFQLEAEGLVRILPHRGAMVAPLSPADAAEALELRGALEPRLLALSAPRLTADDFARADALLEEYAAALRAGATARWGALNTELHLLLYSRAERPRALGLVGSLLAECDRYTRLQLSTDGAELERADREHREIVRLCRNGHVSAARALLTDHIDHVAAALMAFLGAAPGPAHETGIV
ncbi:DNA-binding GntR family transcriptional regulator [Methylobacterium sp. PvP062]|uniref:DNA-binding GntR family transcriptional regulator n=1 Tax=Methylobacterium radiotolerans TaxID=31998 RepID=A0ABV2NQX4_9HYPH|nr:MULTISPECIES: GntR family transcriptional regulator [unclassified Methylobacterium]MBP2494545.1 DNA-binding GntR family transcriptional regulator [Methylobacterium sp. PvP105]MBP2499081.1 DNA-binding GntR family transcriptional regulator [Methylobacterium sp. PvP109]MCX7331593.1 GntR family transcriptional regulator [Hyphomicrobiales bacterium]